LARETDFLDLYKILGLNPGCGLAEFKQAYRRRVAVLHPDRRTGDQVSAIAAERLQQLTALYGSAMEFERRHGRLPGAPPARLAQAEASQPPAPHVSISKPPRRRRRLRWWLMVSVALGCIAWLLWDFGFFSGDADFEPATTTSQLAQSVGGVPEQHPPASPSVLALGMDIGAVRAIEGEPTLIGAGHWEYGPSWIRFEDGKVADWYSSPLRPLKTTTAQPAPTHN
jgi:hypothetical protein